MLIDAPVLECWLYAHQQPTGEGRTLKREDLPADVSTRRLTAMGLRAHLVPVPLPPDEERSGVVVQPVKRLFFYRPTIDSKSQVERYLGKLQKKRPREWARLVAIIEEFGRVGSLGSSFRKHLRGKVWEFRAPRPFQPRVAHADLPRHRVVLLHGTDKKDDQWDSDELSAAERRLSEILTMEDDL